MIYILFKLNQPKLTHLYYLTGPCEYEYLEDNGHEQLYSCSNPTDLTYVIWSICKGYKIDQRAKASKLLWPIIHWVPLDKLYCLESLRVCKLLHTLQASKPIEMICHSTILKSSCHDSLLEHYYFLWWSKPLSLKNVKVQLISVS